MRTVIFGVDGLTFRLLNPLIGRGDLPNFARLQEQGVRAQLLSTIPPVTPPAWMSLVTGMKPAKHGVFDFWEFDELAPKPLPKVVTHRKAGKAIWNILSEFGKKVIVCNVPVTYPPEVVNGLMVSGLMTPDTTASYTYPESLKDELKQVLPGYRIDLSLEKVTTEGYFEAVLQMTEQRILLQEHLLSEYDWDFAMICYVGADRIQHKAWDYVCTLDREATRYYRLLDDALGRVMAHLTPEDLLFVVSDHGFMGASEWFYINEYLQRHNFLQYASVYQAVRSHVISYGREGAKTLHLLQMTRRLREAFDYRFGRVPIENTGLYQPVFEALDWARSRASVLSPTAFIGGSATVNFAQDSPPTMIEELRRRLEAEKHPDSGVPLVRAIYASDAFGNGPFLPMNEQLVVIPSPGITFHLDLGRASVWETRLETRGVHEPEGVFYAWGAGVCPGEQLSTLQIYDVVPTILDAFGISVPETLDGRVITEIFSNQSITSLPSSIPKLSKKTAPLLPSD